MSERPVIEELRDLLDSGEELFDQERRGYRTDHVDETLRTLLVEYDQAIDRLSAKLLAAQRQAEQAAEQLTRLQQQPNLSGQLEVARRQLGEKHAQVAQLQAQLAQAAQPSAEVEAAIDQMQAQLAQAQAELLHVRENMPADAAQAARELEAARQQAQQILSAARVEAESILSRARAGLDR